MFKKCISKLALLPFLLFQSYVYAEDLILLNVQGKPGRDVLELMGDGKTNDFGRPIADNDSAEALNSKLVEGPRAGVVGRYLEYTGDNCGEATCLAMLFYKSFHGILDLDNYHALVFDIKVDQSPTENVGMRIGSWPSRAEIDITKRLPSEGSGWKTVTLTLEEFKNNTFENFDFERTEDVFSLGTSGQMKITLSNIRWVE